MFEGCASNWPESLSLLFEVFLVHVFYFPICLFYCIEDFLIDRLLYWLLFPELFDCICSVLEGRHLGVVGLVYWFSEVFYYYGA